ncbi:hypothetical protein PQO03_16695 [Lentisphaera profundi]|uniref:Uncharacterized protein n=1 Tax=Lentisphaera profundi TaxID=1658616 RepID=A0ABY7VX80_9BACT|nr:hypothetical protein [Lentisphaera profundi]WDE97467.1 hypothetical protein PQO03_16695 [Lentisphaera profundi]
MDYEDCALYIYAQDSAWVPEAKLMNFLLKMNEAYDFSGNKKAVFYNGLVKNDDETFMDFEVEEKQLRELLALYKHSSVGLLDWLGDELLKSVADDFDDVAHQDGLSVDGISFLIGDHEIMSIENKRIVKTGFSFSFYCPDAPGNDLSRLNKALKSDDDFMEHFTQLQDIIGTECDFIIGPA